MNHYVRRRDSAGPPATVNVRPFTLQAVLLVAVIGGCWLGSLGVIALCVAPFIAMFIWLPTELALAGTVVLAAVAAVALAWLVEDKDANR